MNDAASIARALHGRRSGGGYLCSCPLPRHGKGRGDRSPSLLVKEGNKAVLFKRFAGCDSTDILEELRQRGIFDGGSDTGNRHNMVEEHLPEHLANAEALQIWRSGRPIPSGTIQARYLQSRALSLQPPASLRAATTLHLNRYAFPTIVAAVQAPDGRVIAVQEMLLDPSGDRKAQIRFSRLTTGALGWGAVRLAAATHVLGLAEGVETALSAMQLSGVPCWACLGSNRMHRVAIPDCAKELHLFGDNDEPGRAAVERTAHQHRHRRIVVRFPPKQFNDWNDWLQARAGSDAA
jgi:putative DNA primase/helicase